MVGTRAGELPSPSGGHLKDPEGIHKGQHSFRSSRRTYGGYRAPRRPSGGTERLLGLLSPFSGCGTLLRLGLAIGCGGWRSLDIAPPGVVVSPGMTRHLSLCNRSVSSDISLWFSQTASSQPLGHFGNNGSSSWRWRPRLRDQQGRRVRRILTVSPASPDTLYPLEIG